MDDLKKAKKKHKGIKILMTVIAVIALIIVGGAFYLATHTQIVIDIIQKGAMVNGKPLNSYEPLYDPVNGEKENGQYLISEINYGSDYPNSFLDITYPDDDLEADRPTLFYFHGGGFFAGSKNMGDPLAVSEATYLIDDLCAKGYNIVNVDYVLVPEGHFPDPLIQANQAFAYIMEHGKEYHLNTDKIVLMGSSAGAIMVSQIGTVVSNSEYAKLLGIEPVLKKEQISAIVVDDAPLVYEDFSLACKILVGNYVKGSIFLSKSELERYDCIPYMTADYPPAILLGSEYRHDMNVMHEQLDAVTAENVLIDPLAEKGEEKQHCFVAAERVDSTAKEAFDRVIAFIDNKTK